MPLKPREFTVALVEDNKRKVLAGS